MSLRRTITADPGLSVAYWAARLYDALMTGDSIMATTARRELLELGFDVQPLEVLIRPRRRRRS